MSDSASVLMPVYREGDNLVRAIGSVASAARALQISAEILLLVQGDEDHSLLLAQATCDGPEVRLLHLPRPGKFAALRAGATAARGSVFVLVDADSCPRSDAFVRLLAPILSGAADISAARQRVTMPQSLGDGGLIHDWSRVTTEAWHLLRSRHPELLWALPGPLYAVRREFFPEAVLVPLIDDASVGLAALARSARFAYVPEAVTLIEPPPSYLAWCQQKLRTRRGWELLRRRHASSIESLVDAVRTCLSEVVEDEDRRVRLVLWHDRQLRRAATLTASEASGQIGCWQPLRQRLRMPSGTR